MSDSTIFNVVKAGWWGLQIILPAAIVSLKWNTSVWLRSAIAEILAWVSSVAYTIFIYNPAGIAASIERGIDGPKMHYDNNTIASNVLGGWIYPLFVVALYVLWFRFTHRAQPDAPFDAHSATLHSRK